MYLLDFELQHCSAAQICVFLQNHSLTAMQMWYLCSVKKKLRVRA